MKATHTPAKTPLIIQHLGYCPECGATGDYQALLAQRDDLLKALNQLQAKPNDPRAHRVALDAIAKATQPN